MAVQSWQICSEITHAGNLPPMHGFMAFGRLPSMDSSILLFYVHYGELMATSIASPMLLGIAH